MSKFKVKNTEITVISSDGSDYISRIDMVRNQENNHVIIGNWLKNKDTIEYLGLNTFKMIQSPNKIKDGSTSDSQLKRKD